MMVARITAVSQGVTADHSTGPGFINNVALKQVSLQALWCSSINILPPVPHAHSTTYHWCLR